MSTQVSAWDSSASTGGSNGWPESSASSSNTNSCTSGGSRGDRDCHKAGLINVFVSAVFLSGFGYSFFEHDGEVI